MAELVPLASGNFGGVRHAGNRNASAPTVAGVAQATLGNAGGTLLRNPPLMNEDLFIQRFTIIATTNDTYKPFALNTPKTIYAYAIRPVNASDNVGVVFTQATAVAPAQFTFSCDLGSQDIDLLIWAR